LAAPSRAVPVTTAPVPVVAPPPPQNAPPVRSPAGRADAAVSFSARWVADRRTRSRASAGSKANRTFFGIKTIAQDFQAICGPERATRNACRKQ